MPPAGQPLTGTPGTGPHAPGAALRPRTFRKPLPVLGSAGRAYSLFWHHRRMHAGAIWPPVLFLVTAEFLYHRIVGNAHGFADARHAVRQAPWFMSAAALVAWLAGLKFLLSFSISWRRRLLLDERFDPFFFKIPFWRYLGFLLLTYAWITLVLLLALILAPLVLAVDPGRRAIVPLLAVGLPALLFVAWRSPGRCRSSPASRSTRRARAGATRSGRCAAALGATSWRSCWPWCRLRLSTCCSMRC